MEWIFQCMLMQIQERRRYIVNYKYTKWNFNTLKTVIVKILIENVNNKNKRKLNFIYKEDLKMSRNRSIISDNLREEIAKNQVFMNR